MDYWMAKHLTRAQRELLLAIAYRTARGQECCRPYSRDQVFDSLGVRGLVHYGGKATEDGLKVADVLARWETP